MSKIQLLEQETIDKIAAGEVVERPASVVKELVENAIDASATAISVEIKGGGIEYIRITDNGIGIPKDEIRLAFLRHSTSKIATSEDLNSIETLGFRGEALSSICAVSRVELLTKQSDSLLGSRYVIEGGKELSLDDMGCPDGTTFIIRQLFYNTPARKKFLKSETTEGSAIFDVIEHLALSHPEISFKFSVGGRDKLYTSGNGNLKDCLYQVYGREISDNVLDIEVEDENIHINGYIGKSVLARGNRNFECFFVNGRYVKSDLLSKACEEGYYGYMMGHQFPFLLLNIDFAFDSVDVNVHPTKQEVRFYNEAEIKSLLTTAILERLRRREDIIDAGYEYIKEGEDETTVTVDKSVAAPEPFEKSRLEAIKTSLVQQIKPDSPYEKKYEPKNVNIPQSTEAIYDNNNNDDFSQVSFLSEQAKKNHKIIGQVFDTYWIIEYDNSMYIIDQHAAHEKVLFEKTMARIKDNEMTSQLISPPMVLSLSANDMNLLSDNKEAFEKIGYGFEEFGTTEIAITAVPGNMLSLNSKELFLEMLKDCGNFKASDSFDLIVDRVATMSCKAAVKGNNKLSFNEIDELITDLLNCENPFHCPHGRPTIISFSQYELDKKFRRIL